jgi:hypothetical protein
MKSGLVRIIKRLCLSLGLSLMTFCLSTRETYAVKGLKIASIMMRGVNTAMEIDESKQAGADKQDLRDILSKFIGEPSDDSYDSFGFGILSILKM